MKSLSISMDGVVVLIMIVTSSINDTCSFMPLLCCHAVEPVARANGLIEVLTAVSHVSTSDTPEVPLHSPCSVPNRSASSWIARYVRIFSTLARNESVMLTISIFF
jgi:hypothetical protein